MNKKQLCYFAIFIITFPLNGEIYPQPYAPYYSQCGQDKFVNERLFHNKKNGVFVDIGAHDGISYSNTYYFEKKLGWTGICIEPHPDIFSKLQTNRKAICIQGCVSNFNGISDFLKISGAPEMLSGLNETYDPRHRQRIDLELEQFGGSKELIPVNVYTLNEILEKHAIHHIDLLSIDTEGNEELIIKSINFYKITIDVIIVENNYNSPVTRNYLMQYGYQLLAKLDGDEIYCKKEKSNAVSYDKESMSWQLD